MNRQGHGQNSFASLQSDRFGKKVGIASNSRNSRSISNCQTSLPTLQGQLRPLIPDTVSFPMSQTKSSTTLRDEIDCRTPWGRRPLMPTTLPVMPHDLSSGHSPMKANLLPSKPLRDAASLPSYDGQKSPNSFPLQNDHVGNQALESHGWFKRLASPRSWRRGTRATNEALCTG